MVTIKNGKLLKTNSLKRRLWKIYHGYLDIPFPVFLFFVLSIFIVLDIEVFELVFQKESSTESIFFRISMAFISSFIFYYLIVYLPKKREERNLREYINRNLKDIFGISSDVIISCMLKSRDKVQRSGLPSSAVLTHVLKTVRTADASNKVHTSPNGIVHLTIWQLMVNCKREVMQAINNISLRVPSFDSKLVSLLTKIENSTHFFTIYQLGYDNPAETLEHSSKPFIEYIELLKQLGYYTHKRYGSIRFENMFYNEEK